MDNRSSDLSFLDMLSVFSVMLQMQNYRSELRSASNDDLMTELQRQDKMYLEKIVEQNNRILDILSQIVSSDMSAD